MSDVSAALGSRRIRNVVGLAVSLALLGYALYAEHVLGYEPCPLCILQRVALLAVALFFLVAAIHDPGTTGARVHASLLALAAGLGALIAGRHLWIVAQPPGTVAECGASLDYMLDVLPLREVLAKVLTGSGECAKVDWRFLGLTMPAWVLLWFLALGAWGLWSNVGRATRDRTTSGIRLS